MANKKLINYQVISEELEQIVLHLQDPDIDIDKALVLYERGNKVVSELNQYLKTAKNSVEKIKLKTKLTAKD